MEQNRRSNDDDPKDVLLETLSVEHRRQALEFIRLAEGGRASLDAVADHVCTCQSDADTMSRNQILNRLHHIDLPKLDAAGLVAYDPRETTVRIREGGNGERPLEMGSGVETWDDLFERLRTVSVRGDGAR